MLVSVLVSVLKTILPPNMDHYLRQTAGTDDNSHTASGCPLHGQGYVARGSILSLVLGPAPVLKSALESLLESLLVAALEAILLLPRMRECSIAVLVICHVPASALFLQVSSSSPLECFQKRCLLRSVCCYDEICPAFRAPDHAPRCSRTVYPVLGATCRAICQKMCIYPSVRFHRGSHKLPDAISAQQGDHYPNPIAHHHSLLLEGVSHPYSTPRSLRYARHR